MAKAIPKTEKIVSRLLLAGLVVIAGAIFYNGFRKADTEDQEKVRYALPAGWKMTGQWEVYPNGKLYEKIDGQEVIFYEYGVKELDFASASINGADFDIYVYQMNDADAALGVYLSQTPSDFTSIDIGSMGDISGGQIRAIQAGVYLEIMSQEKNSSDNLTLELARSILSSVKSEVTKSAGILRMLPENQRVRGSLSLNKESAFGLTSLGNSYSAAYKYDGDEFNFFIMKISPADASKVITGVRDEVKEFEGLIEEFKTDKLAAKFMDKTLFLIHKDNFIYGVYGKVTSKRAEIYIEQLINGSKK